MLIIIRQPLSERKLGTPQARAHFPQERSLVKGFWQLPLQRKEGSAIHPMNFWPIRSRRIRNLQISTIIRIRRGQYS